MGFGMQEVPGIHPMWMDRNVDCGRLGLVPGRGVDRLAAVGLKR